MTEPEDARQHPGEPSADDTGRESDSEVDDGDAGWNEGWFDYDDEISSRTPPIPGSCPEFPIDLDAMACFPPSFRAAMTDEAADDWKIAIAEELANHTKYGTWELVPQGEATGRILTCGWTFAKKLSQDGSTIRHKARLFEGGCQQSKGQYAETSSPVATLTIFRLLMHQWATTSGSIHHIDVKAAYLNAELAETVYMRVSEGIDAVAASASSRSHYMALSSQEPTGTIS